MVGGQPSPKETWKMIWCPFQRMLAFVGCVGLPYLVRESVTFRKVRGLGEGREGF